MKALLVTGIPHSGPEQVFDLLNRAGVTAARRGRELKHGPQSFQQLLLDSHEVKLEDDSSLKQLRPGRIWHEPASDLLLANVQSPIWGWGDPNTMVLMDFWQEFDPQVRLLLVYADPAQYLINRFRNDSGSAARVSDLKYWTQANRALLEYHLKHPQRTLLVNAQAALAEPEQLTQLLKTSWGMEGLRALPGVAEAHTDLPTLLREAASGLFAADLEACNLEQELRTAAQLPGEHKQQRALDAGAVWASSCALVHACVQKVRDQRKLGEELELKLEEQETTLASLHRDLEQRAQSRAQEARETDELRQRCDRLQAEIASMATMVSRDAHDALDEENQLLKLQAQQLQEELQLYFRKCQELQQEQLVRANGFLADFWRSHQPEVLALDLRRPITGDQWHDPELDGRWTGPATVSTLVLPPLGAGRYLLELDVVDAMEADLVSQAQVEVLGQAYPVSVEYLGGDLALPAICSIEFAVAADAIEPVTLMVRIPQTITPADRGADDSRHLGIRVQQIRLTRQPLDFKFLQAVEQ